MPADTITTHFVTGAQMLTKFFQMTVTNTEQKIGHVYKVLRGRCTEDSAKL